MFQGGRHRTLRQDDGAKQQTGRAHTQRRISSRIRRARTREQGGEGGRGRGKEGKGGARHLKLCVDCASLFHRHSELLGNQLVILRLEARDLGQRGRTRAFRERCGGASPRARALLCIASVPDVDRGNRPDQRRSASPVLASRVPRCEHLKFRGGERARRGPCPFAIDRPPRAEFCGGGVARTQTDGVRSDVSCRVAQQHARTALCPR